MTYCFTKRQEIIEQLLQATNDRALTVKNPQLYGDQHFESHTMKFAVF